MPATAWMTIAPSTGSGSVAKTPVSNRIVSTTSAAVVTNDIGDFAPLLSAAADFDRLPAGGKPCSTPDPIEAAPYASSSRLASTVVPSFAAYAFTTARLSANPTITTVRAPGTSAMTWSRVRPSHGTNANPAGISPTTDTPRSSSDSSGTRSSDTTTTTSAAGTLGANRCSANSRTSAPPPSRMEARFHSPTSRSRPPSCWTVLPSGFSRPTSLGTCPTAM